MEKQKKFLSALMILATMILPAMVLAGSLEPSAAPAPTMKSLDQIPPTWSIRLPAEQRFVVLADFYNSAVLDKETGLVWVRSPSAQTYSWYVAHDRCNRTWMGRMGWRLPTWQELQSLAMEDASPELPTIPNPNPFTGVLREQAYWSATTDARDTSKAWLVRFTDTDYHFSYLKSNPGGVWCVRGGQGVDPQ
jgi:hypothetical protein